jgi:hypothetical protein
MNPQLRALVVCTSALILGCAQWPADGWRIWVTDCGVSIIQRTDTWLNEEDIRDLEWRLTSALSQYEGDACAKLKGYRAFEQDGNMTELNPNYYVAGWTECWNARFFYHRGSIADSHRLKPWNTAFWHEMIHAVQNCPDMSTAEDDSAHPYWTPRGYYNLPNTMGYK